MEYFEETYRPLTLFERNEKKGKYKMTSSAQVRFKGTSQELAELLSEL